MKPRSYDRVLVKNAAMLSNLIPRFITVEAKLSIPCDLCERACKTMANVIAFHSPDGVWLASTVRHPVSVGDKVDVNMLASPPEPITHYACPALCAIAGIKSNHVPDLFPQRLDTGAPSLT